MMEKLLVLVLALTLLAFSSEASPVLTEKEAKQLLRSRRQDRPSKPGFPDEPMRVASFLRACLEVLAEERSYSYTLDRRLVHLYSGKVVLFDQARSFGRDAHGAVKEEGDTRLAIQISRVNPDQ